MPLTYPSNLKISADYATFTGGNLKIYGTIDSVPKTITINVPNNALVTTVNLLSEGTAKTHVIEYQLYDENNQQVYLDKNGNKVSRGTAGAMSTWTVEVDNKTYGTTVRISDMVVGLLLPKSVKLDKSSVVITDRNGKMWELNLLLVKM